jgi:hypothetical protein
MGSDGRVEVHHTRLLAVIRVRKTFPHGLPLKADIIGRERDVRYGPTCDIQPRATPDAQAVV